jgi:hypothetical protein
LSEHLAQDWPLGLTQDDVPKMAIAFKVLLGVLNARSSLSKVIGMAKVGRREVTVRQFEDKRDEANLSSATSKTSSADKGFTIAPFYGLITTVPSFSRARSASRAGDRLTSNVSANSTSPRRSPGW